MIRKFEDYLDRVSNEENRLLIILLINTTFIGVVPLKN